MGEGWLRVGEVARRAGLTVRTLHHYDALGLLVPSAESAADPVLAAYETRLKESAL